MSKKDLFDDTTMTFGEHLEALRYHLWRAIIGLVIGSVVAFYFSRDVIIAIQTPVDAAMHKVFLTPTGTVDKSLGESFLDWVKRLFGGSGSEATTAAETPKPVDPAMVIDIGTPGASPRSFTRSPPTRVPPSHIPRMPKPRRSKCRW